MQTTPVIPLLFICLSFHLKCALFVRPFILRLHHTIRAMQCKMLSMLFFNSRFFLFDDFFSGNFFFAWFLALFNFEQISMCLNILQINAPKIFVMQNAIRFFLFVRCAALLHSSVLLAAVAQQWSKKLNRMATSTNCVSAFATTATTTTTKWRMHIVFYADRTIHKLSKCRTTDDKGYKSA